MSYLHIPNLYRDPRLLEMPEGEVYALEKIHGTSAHVRWKRGKPLFFSSGGAKHSAFVALFDVEELTRRFEGIFPDESDVTVYGEAYGGKMQSMKATYGDHLRFIAFDVKVGERWRDVPYASQCASALGFEFVHWERCPATLEALDRQRDADSVQAVRNGCGIGHKREGIVIRPLTERVDEFGERVIAKHKREDFSETKTPRIPGVAPEVIQEATRAAEEVVTEERLRHVLDKLPAGLTERDTKRVIDAMLEDVYREEGDQLTGSDQERKAISARTARLFKRGLQG